VLEQLYAIVNARYEEERAIVLTTNLDRDALADQINERTVSRLEEMCEILPVMGADHRRPEEPVPEHLGRAASATAPEDAPPSISDWLQSG
jgi:hypothetical protein